MIYHTPNLSRKWQHGQALVEFSLSMIVFLMLVGGIIDFGRALFTYSQTVNSHRSALRYASILGFVDSGETPPYLDCDEIEDRARSVWFLDNQNVAIQYLKADGSGTTYGCPTAASNLTNGDQLQVNVTGEISFFFLPINLDVNLSGRRTIIKEISIGLAEGDEDHDGLDDDWEILHFCNLSGDAYTGPCPPVTKAEINDVLDLMGPQNDPDGDGCPNGCEEELGTDPNNAGSFPPGLAVDSDGDGHNNSDDNCPGVPNGNQNDADSDDIGDACENNDTDTHYDVSDNCPDDDNQDQANNDADAQGDVCDPNDDNDAYDDNVDNCDFVAQADQIDSDFDGMGDACDPPFDNDNDGFLDGVDNCSSAAGVDFGDPYNAYDGCPDSPDADGVPNTVDNCPDDANFSQDDADTDGTGDACDLTPNGDDDSDGFDNTEDFCPSAAGIDYTGTYDPYDGCPDNGDNDLVPDVIDNCPSTDNASQADSDSDGQGDACDTPNPSISGYLLRDPSENCNFNQALTDKQVVLLDETTSTPYSTTTDGSGYFTFPNLTGGHKYKLTVWEGNYQPKTYRIGAQGGCQGGGKDFTWDPLGAGITVQIWVGYK